MIVNRSDERNKALSFADVTGCMVSMNVPHVCTSHVWNHRHHCAVHSHNNVESAAAIAQLSESELTTATVSGELQQTGCRGGTTVGHWTCDQKVMGSGSRLVHGAMATLCKLFTLLWLCHHNQYWSTDHDDL